MVTERLVVGSCDATLDNYSHLLAHCSRKGYCDSVAAATHLSYTRLFDMVPARTTWKLQRLSAIIVVFDWFGRIVIGSCNTSKM